MGKLSNKVAVIIGGNSGIGFATARLFIAAGAKVLIVVRREDAVTEAVAALGPQATGLAGDVADFATHERVAALVSDRFGRADIYVANAGSIRIRVNVLSPGPTDTPIIGKLGVAPKTQAQVEEQAARMIPFGRMGKPEELAQAALFLCSADGQFITGVNLAVDGGITLT